MTRAFTRTLADDPLGGTVRRTVLPGGLRVLTESIPAMRSASVGVWVGIGSRDESQQLSGASHFLEHLLFKGTNRRSALDISAQIEAVGGETNAYTAKEFTCYYARVLDEDVPLAIDVLADVITDSKLDADDVETERGVILEEIAMQRDEPGDEVHDIFAALMFGDHPLAHDISGTPASIEAMDRDQIHRFYKRRYTAPHMVVAAAGNVDHEQVVTLVQKGFAPLLSDVDAEPAPLRDETATVPPAPTRLRVATRDSEQAHLVLGCHGLARRDERRFAFEVLGGILGGGMSSRLFHRIREDEGLAYSVFSSTSEYAETGLFSVYAGCTPDNAHRVLELTNEVLAEIAADGVTASELKRGKGMVKGGLVLGMEDTGSRMARLGRGELLFGDKLTVDEILAKVDAVTLADVAELAAVVLSRPRSLAVAGPFTESDFSGHVS
ncbi:peptidase M16 domain protein [Stackebrandtia nassauensis DSM 44728]|uniref:Peptidase M16 domain protein n=2 Tax=Stackebrandtia TaxID=283810 RepID=D3QAV0_STANL|nr:pitrilysin family protein [Stackebrandtia nassauensis]ADD44746.1 peptidase M16 domain protein [Stackebrandtia nassauensis DSM 44728]